MRCFDHHWPDASSCPSKECPRISNLGTTAGSSSRGDERPGFRWRRSCANESFGRRSSHCQWLHRGRGQSMKPEKPCQESKSSRSKDARHDIDDQRTIVGWLISHMKLKLKLYAEDLKSTFYCYFPGFEALIHVLSSRFQSHFLPSFASTPTSQHRLHV
jgi:hypothetical protein